MKPNNSQDMSAIGVCAELASPETPSTVIAAESSIRTKRWQIRPASITKFALQMTAIAVGPLLASAQFVPSEPSFLYENGGNPTVATSGATIIEVHEGDANGYGLLWYHAGRIRTDGTVNWSPTAFPFDTGAGPSVAISGTNVIEVHQGSKFGFGGLWYHTGQLQPDCTVVWSPSGFQYDFGAKPSLAMSGNDIIEVHQISANAFGPLVYRTAKFRPDGSVTWNATPLQYDNGAAPRIASAGPNIIEVHQGAASGVGPFSYRTAQFLVDGSVSWNAVASNHVYDKGNAPSVSMAGANILEVHNGTADGSGPLWYRSGSFLATGAVVWNSTSYLYDKGGNPSIALAGAVGIEVHQGGAGFGPEWYRTFRY